MNELVQVESERGWKDAKALSDNAGRQPFRADRHQKPEQIEPGFLGESAECSDRLFPFHGPSPIEYHPGMPRLLPDPSRWRWKTGISKSTNQNSNQTRTCVCFA